MEVICTKTFNKSRAIFNKNLKYILIQYEHQSMFYVGILSTAGTSELALPVYPLNEKYRKFFISIKEQRKLKLQKINGTT
jgi:hypothetical protein